MCTVHEHVKSCISGNFRLTVSLRRSSRASGYFVGDTYPEDKRIQGRHGGYDPLTYQLLGVLILPFKDHSSSNPPLDLSSPCASFTHSQSPPLTTPLSQPHSRSLAAFGAPTVVCSTPQRLNAFALKHSLASPSTAVTAHSDSEMSQLITRRRGVINASLAFSAPTVSAMSAPLIGEPTPLTKATPKVSQVLASLTSSVSV
ncbi:hypothetical protein ACFX13_033049 [Malus domestica]